MIEYRVRPVSRFVVTRYKRDEKSTECGAIGEFNSHRMALDVAHALAKFEGGAFCHENYQDVPSRLRNLAEEVSLMIPVVRGVVFLELANGGICSYRLSEAMGDISELAQKGAEGYKQMEQVSKIVPVRPEHKE